MSSKGFGGFRLSEIGLQSISDSNGLMVRPMEMPIATIQRMYFVKPLRAACYRLTDVLLDTFEAMTKNEAFYRGESDTPPERDEDRWSSLLDGSINGEAQAVDELIEAFKLYRPNDTPSHAEFFRLMRVCLTQKIRYLQEVFRERTGTFVHSWSLFTSALASLDKSPSAVYTVEARDRDLERLREAYANINRHMVDFLLAFEDELLHPENAPAAKKDVRQVSDEVQQVAAVTASTERMVHSVNTTVKRIDNRDLSSRGDALKQKRAERIRVQDAAAAIVEEAKKDYELRMRSDSGRFSFEVCFTNQHYRQELNKHGIGSPDQLMVVNASQR